MHDRAAESRRSLPTRAAALAALGLLFAVPATAGAHGPSVPAGQPCPGADRHSGVHARRAAVGCLVNRARTAAGLRGFAWNRALARAATRHARDMASRGYFAHRRSGGPSLGRRVRAAGFGGGGVGEAIAYGCGSRGTPAATVAMWLASAPHRAILLSRRTRVGIGVTGRPPVGCGGPGATYVLDAG